MDQDTLNKTAKQMVAEGKGILAMDESTGTCTKRFQALRIESTQENRRKYRSLLVEAEGLGGFISGAILFDETIRQKTDDGTPIPEKLKQQGILTGIKVDTGAKPLEGHNDETNTHGLDGLAERLKEYKVLGASFAKWRAVITIGNEIPSDECITKNAKGLAQYAKHCQEAGIVPIVEPEVLMQGKHTIETCYEVTSKTQKRVFEELKKAGVYLGGIILKPNMILAGRGCREQPDLKTISDMTVKCLKENVPAQVPGVAFLSGGQSDEDSTLRLNEMNKTNPDLAWKLTFSYGRGLQREALKTWAGDDNNKSAAQKALLKHAENNSQASMGKYIL